MTDPTNLRRATDAEQERIDAINRNERAARMAQQLVDQLKRELARAERLHAHLQADLDALRDPEGIQGAQDLADWREDAHREGIAQERGRIAERDCWKDPDAWRAQEAARFADAEQLAERVRSHARTTENGTR